MTHDHMEPEQKKPKYWTRFCLFSIVQTLIFAAFLEYIGINNWWSMIPSLATNIIYIYYYDRLMIWLNDRSGYFWLIIIASLILSVAFLLQIYVRFWLEVL